jgi:hypothetical protein
MANSAGVQKGTEGYKRLFVPVPQKGAKSRFMGYRTVHTPIGVYLCTPADAVGRKYDNGRQKKPLRHMCGRGRSQKAKENDG